MPIFTERARQRSVAAAQPPYGDNCTDVPVVGRHHGAARSLRPRPCPCLRLRSKLPDMGDEADCLRVPTADKGDPGLAGKHMRAQVQQMWGDKVCRAQGGTSRRHRDVMMVQGGKWSCRRSLGTCRTEVRGNRALREGVARSMDSVVCWGHVCTDRRLRGSS
ncbi:hypothetical protein EVG20_g7405 [Dentipellis fragilis]|uniref:Uncharacterized protein n=1 Tax=Dentipellis fragilis TaxID=205917 RepID=A0A4Y9YE37_9AGAM|nr:hypothetical protein EVG20_g7405 [Dentipellis fragilis]